MFYKKHLIVATMLYVIVFAQYATAQITPEWVRYAAISPDASEIAFVYKGDIYTVAIDGGEAKRLTFNPAHDYKPVWNRDGSKLAFASERFGNLDIFIMDANGGEATRLTFDSADEIPYDFIPASDTNPEHVVFKAKRIDTAQHRQYPSRSFPETYKVSSLGGAVQHVFTMPAAEANVSSDGTLMVYEDIKGYENEWRKHHRSSVTRDIWAYDFQNKTHKQLSTFDGEDRDPVLSDDNETVFFLSEKSGSFNVYSMPLKRPKRAKQLTDFSLHPVRFLSQAKGILVFTHHGKLYKMSLGAEPQAISISIRTQNTSNREIFTKVNGKISEFSLSPDGKEIAYIANGDVFVSSKDGAFTKQVTDTPETESSVSFSTDGERLVYASERNLKWRIHETTKMRKEEPFFYASSLLMESVLIESEKDSYQPKFSPDGKKIAFIEERRTLKVMNLDGTEPVTLVSRDKMIHFRDVDQYFQWSPDSQYLLFTYDRLLNNADTAIVKADGSEPVQSLSQSAYYDSDGRWVMDGKAILYFSNRDGLRSYATSGRTEVDVYAAFLQQDGWDEFRLSKDDFSLQEAIEEANEEASEASEKNTDTQEDDNSKEENNEAENSEAQGNVEPISIEWDGIEQRIARLTIHSSFVSDAVLDKDAKNLYYLTRFEDKLGLWKTELRTKKTKKLIALKASRGSLQWDNDKETLYMLSGGKLSTLHLAKEKAKPINFKAKAEKSRPAMYAAFFDHVWLRTQKAFYDPSFHGLDWQQMYDEYQPKVAHIDNAREFAELISEMIGELNVSHAGARATVGFGIDNPDKTARLGIFYDDRFEGKGLKITEILKGGPLDKASINIQPNDVITHIDGVEINQSFDWSKLLNQKEGKFVLLSVVDTSGESSEFTVKPISIRDEDKLLYQRFVDINEKEVLAKSNGKLGYVHIPSMSDGPYRTVFDTMLGKHYDKQGIVVDARFNGGGDLVADLAMFFTGEPFITYETVDKRVGGEPTSRYTKPIVGLFNESMYSDGHCYASGFEDLNLGTSIGMPVPGTCSFAGWERLPIGIVWGMVPVSAKNKKGEWMENNQMEPDIKIKNQPELISSGRDQQLEQAVKTLSKQTD